MCGYHNNIACKLFTVHAFLFCLCFCHVPFETNEPATFGKLCDIATSVDYNIRVKRLFYPRKMGDRCDFML